MRHDRLAVLPAPPRAGSERELAGAVGVSLLGPGPDLVVGDSEGAAGVGEGDGDLAVAPAAAPQGVLRRLRFGRQVVRIAIVPRAQAVRDGAPGAVLRLTLDLPQLLLVEPLRLLPAVFV